jgi:STE24 endopeptidase
MPGASHTARPVAGMRLSTYRKLRPGRFEEFLFYDHPSGYARVHAAMIWLRENQALVTSRSSAAYAALIVGTS